MATEFEVDVSAVTAPICPPVNVCVAVVVAIFASVTAVLSWAIVSDRAGAPSDRRNVVAEPLTAAPEIVPVGLAPTAAGVAQVGALPVVAVRI
jgi:hypothetical protein